MINRYSKLWYTDTVSYDKHKVYILYVWIYHFITPFQMNITWMENLLDGWVEKNEFS
jgi:hypothetical protein